MKKEMDFRKAKKLKNNYTVKWLKKKKKESLEIYIFNI